MLNEQLNDLYRNNLVNLMEMYSVLDGQKIFHYVGPLLIYCWEERYLSSKYRLMIIGQETNGWYDNYVINSETRVCHKSVTHPLLFFAFSQIRNL